MTTKDGVELKPLDTCYVVTILKNAKIVFIMECVWDGNDRITKYDYASRYCKYLELSEETDEATFYHDSRAIDYYNKKVKEIK